MIKSEQLQIEDLSKKREMLLDKRDASWNDEKDDWGGYEYEPKEIDELAEEIERRIKEWRNLLSFEFIMEQLTMLGDAPNLLYDDNGHWAITGEGYQNVVTGEPADLETHFMIEAKHWKNTIREALNDYLDYEED
jgi:hypothetical protein